MSDPATDEAPSTGHRSAGGIRVSMYNATSPADIEKLVGFMDSFAKNNK